jgi:hypothetical protein
VEPEELKTIFVVGANEFSNVTEPPGEQVQPEKNAVFELIIWTIGALME